MKVNKDELYKYLCEERNPDAMRIGVLMSMINRGIRLDGDQAGAVRVMVNESFRFAADVPGGSASALLPIATYINTCR